MGKPRNNDASLSGQVGSGKQTGKPFDRVTFFDGYLDADDRKWIEDNYHTAPTAIFDLLKFAGDYGGISIKFEQRSGKFLAILFGGDTPETGKGYALTARASTPTLAGFVLAYKALHKFTGEWFAGGGSSDTLDFS